MARPSRLFLPGIPLHIIQRGGNRQDCFLDDADRRRYLAYLRACLLASPCRVHAYVLMRNHIHLLLSAQDIVFLSRVMKTLNQRYTQYFNWRYGCTGSLWEGRYKSCLVQGERYLLTCQRYIELNPVRAGMVKAASHYRWSSYRSNALGTTDQLLSPHALYLSLGQTDAERQGRYRALFEESLTEQCVTQLRVAINAEFVIGDQAFLQRAAHAWDQRQQESGVRPVGSDPSL